jgi:hypothetical protein
VAVEVTCSLGPSKQFDAKVGKWVELLSRGGVEARSTSVVFVVAPKNMAGAGQARLRRSVLRKVGRVLSGLGVSADARARVGVASWREWFPAPGRVGEGFYTMCVACPTGPQGDGLWQRRTWLGGGSDGWLAPGAAVGLSQGFMERVSTVAGVPKWFRGEGSGVAIPALLVAGRSGFPARPGVTVRVGSGQGVVSAVGVPSRVRDAL